MGKFYDYINVTAPLHSATTKGKLGNANEIFTENDEDNVQNVINKTDEHIKKLDNRSSQMEESIKNISVTGGASVAEAVTYNNTTSGLEAVNVKGAVDELATKNKSQDAEISKKANSADVTSQMQTEQIRVNKELSKKFNNENIVQESGDAKDKVMSQKVVSDKLSDLSENLSKSFPSVFNSGDTYIPIALAHEFTAINQSVALRFNNLSGNFRILVTTNFTDTFSNYITIGIDDSNGTTYKTNPDFSYKQRFVFDLGNVSGLSRIVIGTYGITNFKPCVFSAVLYNKNTEDFVDIWKSIDEEIDLINTEQTRLNKELDKKFNLENITQTVGKAKDKVISQEAVTYLFKVFPSIFNNGEMYPIALAHEFTAINQSVTLRPNNLSGNFRILVTTNFTDTFANYITITIDDSNGTTYKTNPDFSYKQRFVFDLRNVSGLSRIVIGTYGKLSSSFKPCIVSAFLYNKNTKDFVDIWKSIDEEKANTSEVNSLVKNIEDKISSNEGTTIECSESFICPVGETIQIFYKSIFNGININDFVISCRSNVGKSYPRYFEYKATELGNKSVTFNLCKFNGYEYKVVSTKSVTIECIEHPKSSSKNILIIGDSLTLYNSMQDEILRRINNEGGEPKGYKLACNFLGRKTTSNGTKYEGISGYSWQKYTTRLGRSFKFTVPSTTNTSVGSKYKVTMDNGSIKNLQVIEVNISNTDSVSSYIKLIYDNDFDDLKQNPIPSGTLVKISGTGDTNISYTKYETEKYSPFLDNSNNIDFRPYFDKYCDGNVDIMIIELGTNDITSLLNNNLNTFDLINNYINEYCKKFISKLHEQYPNTQLVILGLHKCSQNGGMNNVANSSDNTRYCRYLFKWNKALQDMTKENNYTHYIDVNAQFDSENSYDNNVTKQVNLRSSKVEHVDYNNVHPITSGLQLIADSVVRYLCKIL